MPQGESFFMVNSQGGSQFWKGLHKAKRLFHWGAVKHVNSGRQTLFWHDVWLGASPLKCQFWRLFHICQDPDVSVCLYYPNEKIYRSPINILQAFILFRHCYRQDKPSKHSTSTISSTEAYLTTMSSSFSSES